MKINPTNNINFKSLYTNKYILKTLEKISDNSASFVTLSSFACATILRPAAISLAPKVKDENKKTLSSESIASALAKLALALCVSIPIEKTIKNINQNTIKNINAAEFNFISQIIKLSSNLISAIPKSILSVALIPLIIDMLPKKEKIKPETQNISFKGLEKPIRKLIENDDVQNFAKKHAQKSKNIARNMTVLNDLTLATTSIIATRKSKKIKEENKKPLILNKAFSTIASITLGCGIDEIIQKTSQKSLDNFINANKNNPKLLKYINGLNVLRPTLIFAGIYYFLIPIVSAFSADKLSNNNAKN